MYIVLFISHNSMKESYGIASFYKWGNQDPDKLRAFFKSGVPKLWAVDRYQSEAY